MIIQRSHPFTILTSERIELGSEVSKIVREQTMIRVLSLFGVLANMILTTGMGLAQSQLDLVIPSFEVQDATVEQTVRELLRWGIQVGLAVESGEDATRVVRSLTYHDIPIRGVLEIVAVEYPDCRWGAYRSEGVHPGLVRFHSPCPGAVCLDVHRSSSRTGRGGQDNGLPEVGAPAADLRQICVHGH